MTSQDLDSVKFNRRYFVKNLDSTQDHKHNNWVIDATVRGIIIYDDPMNQTEKYEPDIQIDFEIERESFINKYLQMIVEKQSQGFKEVNEKEFYQTSLSSLKQKLLQNRLQKPAWSPLLDTEASIDWGCDSYYGGASYIKGHEYPRCKSLCNEPLSHFLQINLSALPQDLDFPVKTGLVKIFYCTNTVSECSDCSPQQDYDNPWYYFTYIPSDKTIDIENFREISSAPTKKITGWQPLPMELPTYKDFSEGFEFKSLPFDASDAEKYAFTWLLDATKDEDKLGGHPLWIQHQNWLTCSDCQNPMQYLYQLDSGGHTDFYFGSGGIGHVFLCPKDFKVFFVWDCT